MWSAQSEHKGPAAFGAAAGGEHDAWPADCRAGHRPQAALYDMGERPGDDGALTQALGAALSGAYLRNKPMHRTREDLEHVGYELKAAAPMRRRTEKGKE